MIQPTLEYEYRLCESDCILDGAHHIGYGISVIDKFLGKEILCIEDITISKGKILRLIKTCNMLRLSPVHIYDVIDDFLE